jgi:hypothetical protein
VLVIAALNVMSLFPRSSFCQVQKIDSRTSEHHLGVPSFMQVCIELLPPVSSVQFVVRLLTVALFVFVCRLQYIHCFEQLREIAACGEGQDRITHVLYLTGNIIE